MFDLSFSKPEEIKKKLMDMPLAEVREAIHTRVAGIGSVAGPGLLSRVPYRKILDLAFVYFIEKEQEGRRELIYIDNEMLDKWGTGIEELHDLAMKNTIKDKPAMFLPLGEVMDESDPIPGNEGLFILSAKGMFMGACAMFYPGRLKEISGMFGCGLTILPSSVHECIVLPQDDPGKINRLYEIVKGVNDNVLDPKDILSYSVYRYSAENDELSIAKKTTD